MVDVQFEDVTWVERRPETGLRTGNPRAKRKAKPLGKYIWVTSWRDGRLVEKKGPFYKDETLKRAYRHLRVRHPDDDIHVVSADEPLNWPRYAMGYNPAPDIYDPEQEQWRRQVLGVYKTQRERGQTHGEAKASAFAITQAVQVRDKRRKKGTTEPTAKGRREAKAKLKTPDAWKKRQEWELMIGKGRKSGKYRVVPEHVDGQMRYYIQPGGTYRLVESRAHDEAERLNSGKKGRRRVAANPPTRENWLPAAAAVLTVGDVGYRGYKDWKKKKRKKKAPNPRQLSELGGMTRGYATLPAPARAVANEARVLGRLKGLKMIALEQVPPSRKQKFQQLRSALERDIEDVDHKFKRLLTSITDQMPGGEYGRPTADQKRARSGLSRAFSESMSDVLHEHTRKKELRRSRRTRNPDEPFPKHERTWRAEAAVGRGVISPKRTRGIAIAGTGDPWSDVKARRPAQGMPASLRRDGDTYYLSWEGRSKKIPRAIQASNRNRSLKGPRWENALIEKIEGGMVTRYAIQHPRGKRGSESDPYKIIDTKTGMALRQTFTRKKEADAKLQQLQDRPRRKRMQVEGAPLYSWRTTSKARAAWVASELPWLEVPRGTFEALPTAPPKYRTEQAGPYRLYDIGPRPPVDRRRRFFPRSYTLVIPRGVPFANREFDSPAKAVTFALRQREEAGGQTLREALQKLGKRMPDYKALGEAKASLTQYLGFLKAYGYGLSETSTGKGRDKVVTYKITSGPAKTKGTLEIVPVTLRDEYEDRSGKVVTKTRKAYSLREVLPGGVFRTYYTGTKAEAEKAKKARLKAPKGRTERVSSARKELARRVATLEKAEGRLDRFGTPGRPPFTLLAHGKGGSIAFTEKGFDLTGPVGVVKVNLDREGAPVVEQIFLQPDRETKRLAALRKAYNAEVKEYQMRQRWYEDKEEDGYGNLRQERAPRKPEKPDFTRKSRSLGHPELDWLGALRSKQTGLSPGGKRRLRERREERALSELQTRAGRSPGVRAPSKRRAVVGQFQYRQREAPAEVRYLREHEPPRKPRKLTKAQRRAKAAELAEVEARLAEIEEKSNPYRQNFAPVGAILKGGKWLVTSSAGKQILAEAAIIGTMMVGEKLVSKGKVSPKVMRYIQARVEKETGRKPTRSEVQGVLQAIDPNQDQDLTAAEVARVLKRGKK